MTHKDIADKLIAMSGARHPLAIFQDWVTMLALSIVNASTIRHDDVWKAREEQWNSIAKTYSDEELDKFAEITADLCILMETSRYDDHLGKIYMESMAGNKNIGQFFTPYDLSYLSAKLTGEPDGNIESIAEPSCGSGGMIIARSQIIHERGYDEQKLMRALCQDLDWTAVYMCYIQLSLLGIDAIVVQGDTLTEPYTRGYEKSRIFRTPRNAGALIGV